MRFAEHGRRQRPEDPYASYRPKDIYGSTGFYVWEQEEAGADRFVRLRFFCLAAVFLTAFLLVIGLSIISIYLPVQTRAGFLLGAVVGITVALVVCAHQIGIRSQGLLCVFVRDEWGRIYLFDYTMPAFQKFTEAGPIGGYHGGNPLAYLEDVWKTAKALREIRRNRAVERVMASGGAKDYGNEVTQVRKLRERARGCEVSCLVQRAGGEEFVKKVFVPASVENYEALLSSLQRMQG